MVLNGYCDVQKCNCTISLKVIPAPTYENPNEVAYGTIFCEYASYGGDCDSKNCSILKQHNIKR